MKILLLLLLAINSMSDDSQMSSKIYEHLAWLHYRLTDKCDSCLTCYHLLQLQHAIVCHLELISMNIITVIYAGIARYLEEAGTSYVNVESIYCVT